MNMARILKHLSLSHWKVSRCFSGKTLKAVESAVGAAERHHRGELRFVVEGMLPILHLLRNISARQRAVELFSQLRVWDTGENSGVLIYVQLADRRVEILADRGIAARVPQAEWDAICRGMEHAFKNGDYRGGTLDAIAKAGKLLTAHFPAAGANPNELPDRPLVL